MKHIKEGISVIYIFKTASSETTSGIGYVLRTFEETFPNAVVVSQEHKLSTLSEGDVVFVPRIFPAEYPYVHSLTPFLLNTKAKVIQTPFVDTPMPPLYVLHSLGKADLIHAPSTFIAKLFRPNKSVVLPIPVKPFTKRRKNPAGKRIGAVIASVHERKNIEGYLELASLLPDYTLHIVLTGDWRKHPHREPIVRKLFYAPNIIVHEHLSDDEMQEFYHMLDWFVVLSGGEGYCLPAREALRCGVPVIAPRHTAFLDLAGVRGVFLVNTHMRKTEAVDGRTYLWEFPRLKDVVEVIKEKTPPAPDSVEDPTPSFEQWVQRWREILNTLDTEKPAWVHVNEPSALWGVLNFNMTLGLVDVSTRWAARTNGCVFSLNGTLPQGVSTPIIIPYAHGISDWTAGLLLPPFYHILALLRRYNPKACLTLWVHNNLPPATYGALSVFVDKFIGTTEQMCFTTPYITHYLPLPIGAPPAPDAPQETYFLVWGMNYTTFDWFKTFLGYFKHPVLFVYTYTTELPAEAVSALIDLTVCFASYRYANKKLITTLPLERDEMEKIVDSAAGYICLDFYYPTEIVGEASARIPYVLRKGKPIIANDAPRNLAWLPYITPIKFSKDMLLGAPDAVVELVSKIENNLDAYVPKNVPPLEKELEHFYNLLKALREGNWD